MDAPRKFLLYGMCDMRALMTGCLSVILLLGSPLNGNETGFMGHVFLQNKDRVPGSISALANGTAGFQAHIADQVAGIEQDWVQYWAAETSGAPEPVGELHELILVSGQTLYGTLLDATPEDLGFQLSWGPVIRVPRTAVHWLGFRVKVSSQPWEEGRLDMTSGNGTHCNQDWEQDGFTLRGHVPDKQTITRLYEETYRNLVLDLDLDFIGEEVAYNLRLQPMKTENAASSLFRLLIRYENRTLTFFSPLITNQQFKVSIPEGHKSRPHHVRVIYDYEVGQLKFLFNGTLLQSWNIFLPEGQMLVKDPVIRLAFDGPYPIAIQRLELSDVPPHPLPADVEGPGFQMLFVNGDQVGIQDFTYQAGTLNAQVGEQAVPIPLARIAGIKWQKLQQRMEMPLHEVTLRHVPLRLYATEVRVSENGDLRLTLPELPEPVQLPIQRVTSIEWPGTEGGELIQQGSFCLQLKETLRMSGEVRAVTDHHLELQPIWAKQTFLIPTSALFILDALNPPEKNDAPDSYLVLRNGSVLAGNVLSETGDLTRLQSNVFGELDVLRSYTVNQNIEGNWLEEPLQLFYGLAKLPDVRSFLPDIEPNGDIVLQRPVLFRHRLPADPPPFGIRLSLEKVSSNRNLILSLQQKGGPLGRVGMSVGMSRYRLSIDDPFSEKTEVMLLPSRIEKIEQVELLLDPQKRQMKLSVNGIELFGWKQIPFQFDYSRELEFTLSGLVKGSRIQDANIQPIQSLGPEERGMNAMELPSPSPYESFQQDSAISVFLGRSRIRANSIRLQGEALEIQHPAFPQDIRIPFSKVRGIRWQETPKHEARLGPQQE